MKALDHYIAVEHATALNLRRVLNLTAEALVTLAGHDRISTSAIRSDVRELDHAIRAYETAGAALAAVRVAVEDEKPSPTPQAPTVSHIRFGG